MAIRASDRVTLAVVATPTSIQTYYLKQPSASAAPAKPTTSTPPSPWTLTEPAYTAGSTDTLYTVQRNAWGDGTFEYGNVQKSSSFEAAKQAYTLASTANNNATSASNKYTSSTVAPTTANGTGKAIGSVWEVNVNGTTTGKYVWTGSVWTEMKVGSALIADTIIGKTISGGTITGTNIDSVVYTGGGMTLQSQFFDDYVSMFGSGFSFSETGRSYDFANITAGSHSSNVDQGILGLQAVEKLAGGGSLTRSIKIGDTAPDGIKTSLVTGDAYITNQRSQYIKGSFVEVTNDITVGPTATVTIPFASNSIGSFPAPDQVPGQQRMAKDTKHVYVSDGTAWKIVKYGNDTDWAVIGGQSGAKPRARYRRKDGHVEMTGFASKAAQSYGVFTLPAGFRPPADFWVVNMSDAAWNTLIRATGSVESSNYNATEVGFYFSFSLTA